MDRYFIASGDLLDSLSELAVVKFLGIWGPLYCVKRGQWVLKSFTQPRTGCE